MDLRERKAKGLMTHGILVPRFPRRSRNSPSFGQGRDGWGESEELGNLDYSQRMARAGLKYRLALQFSAPDHRDKNVGGRGDSPKTFDNR